MNKFCSEINNQLRFKIPFYAFMDYLYNFRIFKEN